MHASLEAHSRPGLCRGTAAILEASWPASAPRERRLVAQFELRVPRDSERPCHPVSAYDVPVSANDVLRMQHPSLLHLTEHRSSAGARLKRAPVSTLIEGTSDRSARARFTECPHRI